MVCGQARVREEEKWREEEVVCGLVGAWEKKKKKEKKEGKKRWGDLLSGGAWENKKKNKITKTYKSGEVVFMRYIFTICIF